jgi:hypothetical protein
VSGRAGRETQCHDKQETTLMCSRVTCPTCGKPSYVGCGRHVEQVLGDVPRDERCRCREAMQTEPRDERSFLDRLFGR